MRLQQHTPYMYFARLAFITWFESHYFARVTSPESHYFARLAFITWFESHYFARVTSPESHYFARLACITWFESHSFARVESLRSSRSDVYTSNSNLLRASRIPSRELLRSSRSEISSEVTRAKRLELWGGYD